MAGVGAVVTDGGVAAVFDKRAENYDRHTWHVTYAERLGTTSSAANAERAALR
ncbi:hypothetical protein ACQPW3_33485 [Actinosynnema sp. CA-248983]